ncbi:MAG: hypothetical protein IJ524_02960 [Bacteroidales bacterium]|nr:hypothetical protein [Bacteroidales bacterium]
MKQCKWCGRHFKEGTGVGEGMLFGYGGYCSEKCREEDRQARASGGGTKPYRWVWWIVGFIVLYLLFHK